MQKINITGVINAKNESRYIGQAIASLQTFAQEVIVADMASTDNTRDIANNMGAKVIEVKDFGYVEPARALAVESASHEWIFVLDADEIVPLPLADELRRLALAGSGDAFSIPELNFMFGVPIRHTGWSPDLDRHVRFFRKGSVHLSNVIHDPIREISGATLYALPAKDEFSIHHFNYSDWSSFLRKLDRYTTVEANHRFASGETISGPRVAGNMAKEFLRRFIKHQGYRDGYRGAVLTSLMMTYQLAIYAKLRQLREVGDEAKIVSGYMQRAQQLRDKHK